MSYSILQGDCIATMKTLPAASVQCVVTSPPYLNLRSYLPDGHPDKHLEIGGEQSVAEYVGRLVEVFREVRRVLREDGVLFLNLGDSYNGSGGAGGDYGPGGLKEGQPKYAGSRMAGLKPKDLIGVPWECAFALRADGWWLRQEIIWHKKAPMPESVTDRCTKAHEQVFLLTKSAQYYFDADAIREENAGIMPYGDKRNFKMNNESAQGRHGKNSMFSGGTRDEYIEKYYTNGRNKRSVWTLGPESYIGAHFATMPTKLVEPCILAGTSAHGCCSECGAPWARVTERTREHGLADTSFPKTDGLEAQNGHKRLHQRIKAARAAGEPHDNPLGGTVTTGWAATCDCGTWYCTCCSFVVQYPQESVILNKKEDIENAAQRPREGESIQGGVGKAEVCPEPGMAGASQEGQADTRKDVRSMRPDVHGAEEQSVLQPELLSRVDVAQRPSESVSAGSRTNQSLPEGLQAVQLQGIQDAWGIQDNPPAGSSNGECEGLCAGASACDGRDCWAESATGRSSTPQERCQDGQPSRKPGTVDQEYASPVAQPGVSSLRKAVCPHCKQQLVHEPAPITPCVVLDPFCGSGTTGVVSLKHGRHFIGLELNESYISLAHDRISRSQPMLLAVTA